MYPLYSDLLERFEKWLNALSYAESTVYASVNYTRDFFIWLSKAQIKELNQINKQVINSYYIFLLKRKNKRQSGSLSVNYINSNINALSCFSKYLEVTGRAIIEIDLKLLPRKTISKIILTQAEINALFKACDNDVLGIRDKAMLSIYYGCGLRRSEGIGLNVSDVLLKEKRIFVRKGKNYKQRYVPMTEAVKENLSEYIFGARETLLSLNYSKTEALFLSLQIRRIQGSSLIKRLNHLKKQARIEKQIGLHTLRHSIATHLLQSGMTLEEVKQFLGHSSLESTQIYTHLSYEQET